MNGSLPEKSEPLLSARYEPLAREAKMPKAQLSKAPAVSYCEIQLDILTKLAEHIVHIDGVVGSSPTVTTRAEAVENQRLLLLCIHPGVHCPGVVFVGVNGSDNPNCQNCRLAQLPELSGWLHWWK